MPAPDWGSPNGSALAAFPGRVEFRRFRFRRRIRIRIGRRIRLWFRQRFRLWFRRRFRFRFRQRFSVPVPAAVQAPVPGTAPSLSRSTSRRSARAPRRAAESRGRKSPRKGSVEAAGTPLDSSVATLREPIKFAIHPIAEQKCAGRPMTKRKAVLLLEPRARVDGVCIGCAGANLHRPLRLDSGNRERAVHSQSDCTGAGREPV